jgi:hypothetical protein
LVSFSVPKRLVTDYEQVIGPVALKKVNLRKIKKSYEIREPRHAFVLVSVGKFRGKEKHFVSIHAIVLVNSERKEYSRTKRSNAIKEEVKKLEK